MTQLRLFLLFALVWLAVPAASPHAETLNDAMIKAYRNNASLEAARRAAAAASEEISQATANFKPSLTFSGQVERSRIEVDGFPEPVIGSPKSADVTISQPIFRGGSSWAGYKRARASIFASYAALQRTEETTLLNAIEAFSNLVRDRTILGLRRNNVAFLERQLEEAEIRFRVGELTKTDVAQSQSRLALAQAEMATAEANLQASKEAYRNIIGEMPGRIFEAVPYDLKGETVESLLETGLARAPEIREAELREEAARHQIDENFGQIMPQVGLEGSARRTEDSFGFGTAGSDFESYSLLARVTIPLYQGGAQASRVRQARQTASQLQMELEQTRRTVRENIISAFERYQATVKSVASLQKQVSAAEIALEGVKLEEQQGVRTILDVLDAEQEALDARTRYITARRDLVVASYAVLAAIGGLTAQNLGLNVDIFNTNQLYETARDRWWGFK